MFSYMYPQISKNLKVAIDYSIHFHNFQQETIILSRLKKETFNPGAIEHSANYSTLHSLAIAILPKNYLSKLDGEPTWNYVERAVSKIIPAVRFLEEKEKKKVVNSYYFAIRAKGNNHQNADNMLANLKYGKQVNNLYQTTINRGLNWEESLTAATWYLNHDNNLRTELEFDNFIIIDMDLLKDPRNKNALDFLNALYLWGVRQNKNWSFDVIDPDSPELMLPMHVNLSI